MTDFVILNRHEMFLWKGYQVLTHAKLGVGSLVFHIQQADSLIPPVSNLKRQWGLIREMHTPERHNVQSSGVYAPVSLVCTQHCSMYWSIP